MTSDLTPRGGAVLDAVVRHFIASGQPAGSATVAGLLAEKVSSATVRNTMAKLTRMGYLKQPHTSAGRIPTARGYVAYVQHLMGEGRLPDVDEAGIRESLDGVEPELAALLQRACSVLSEMTHHVGVVLAPPPAESAIRHVELVRLGGGRVSVVFVIAGGMVHTRTIEVDEELGEAALGAAADYLRRRFVGRTLRHLRRSLRARRRSADGAEAVAARIVRRSLSDTIDDAAMLVEGAFYLLDSPELAQRETLPDIFAAVERGRELSRVLASCGTDSAARVLIGRDGLPASFGGCALVAAGYRSGPRPVGALGVLGPARMDYERTIPTVTTMARVTSDLVTRLCA